MNRRTRILITVVATVLVAVPVAFFVVYAAASFGSDAGSPSLAEEWGTELDQFATLHAAEAANQTFQVIKFDNGEWLFGRAQNSHGIWRRGGGTVVVKDSNGNTRAFLGGHVCGNHYLIQFLADTADLASFYAYLEERGFAEYDLK